MGYYTYYTLSAHPTMQDAFDEGEWINDKQEDIIAREIAEILDGAFNHYSEDYEGMVTFHNAVGYDSMKWYDHDSDMLKISKKYPDIWFSLSGEGEEKGDLWRTIYHNGKMSTIQVEFTWPEFDASDFEDHNE